MKTYDLNFEQVIQFERNDNKLLLSFGISYWLDVHFIAVYFAQYRLECSSKYKLIREEIK